MAVPGAPIGHTGALAVSELAAQSGRSGECLFILVGKKGSRHTYPDAAYRLLIDGMPGGTDFSTSLSPMAAALGRPVQAGCHAARLGISPPIRVARRMALPLLNAGQLAGRIPVVDAVLHF